MAMAIYAIHCPSLSGDTEAAAERLRATKLGFCYRGFVFGPFWLAAQRLWLPLLVYVAVAGLMGFLVASGVLAAGAVVALEILAALLIGLEGRDWLGLALARRGSPLVDIIEARDEDEAARIYFTRALAAGASARAAAGSGAPRAMPGVIGSLPEALRQ